MQPERPKPKPGAKPVKPERWSYREYYLDRPWPDRGGVWYACHYDGGTGGVRRQSLHTADFEQAKANLIALATTVPAAGDPPRSKDVLSVRVFEAYLDGHGATIRTKDAAARALALATEWLLETGQETAKVADWTPARQEAFAKWLVETKNLAAATIKRHFNVIGAAFQDAAKLKMRDDPSGEKVEAALIAYAPKIAMTGAMIAQTLKIAEPKEGGYTPSMEEMAKFVDATKSEHLRRWTILALTTWARPEAIADFEPRRQYSPLTGVLNLNPPGRLQTKKVRPKIVAPLALTAWLDEWARVDAAAWTKKNGAPLQNPTPLLMFKRKRVANVKRGVKRLASEIGLPEFSQYCFRRFMPTMVRKLCPLIPREKRSLWLGHSVAGSRTTKHYENFDPDVIEDVALATDFVLCELQKRCRTRLLAVELFRTAPAGREASR